MSENIPRLTDVELQIILDSDVTFPKNITELDFHHQIQSNQKIKWDVNPFVLEEKRVRIMLDAPEFNRWKSIQRISNIVGVLIVYWSLRIWTYEMLLLLLVIPFTIGAFPHFLFIVCIGLTIAVKFYFSLTIPFFWLIIFLVGFSYTITKISNDKAKRTIIEQGLSNWRTFWKYYSNKIIYPIWVLSLNELENLIERYPELALSNKSEDN
ncbi:MAG: hypothetical protein ACKVT2_16935, partial [Saprospiraceae bacterium]